MLPAIVLAFAGLAAAAPATISQFKPSFPPKNTAKGFQLLINVTDISRDFADNPVHGQFVTGFQASGVRRYMVPGPAASANVFFVNGSAEGLPYGWANTLLDIGGPAPYGVQMDATPTDNAYGIVVGIGPGTLNVGPASELNPLPCDIFYGAQPGSFAVCDTGFVATYHPKYLIQYFAGRGSFYNPENIPDNCVPVQLLPGCHSLENAQTATYEIERIWDSVCYDDVASIVWPEYAKCY